MIFNTNKEIMFSLLDNKMLPNKYVERSFWYPGVIYEKIIPIAIPIDIITPIPRSSSIPKWSFKTRINIPEMIANIIPKNKGSFIGKLNIEIIYIPIPIPPKDAWLILDDMKTIFLLTMYVPIIPQDILDRSPTINAFCINEYCDSVVKKFIFNPFHVCIHIHVYEYVDSPFYFHRIQYPFQ